ncbi:MAG: glycoside hydrolase family 97 N-terminal domain-containing protein [Verrucomicrobiota bacterium]|nr:glycoside hydrolase family 97 N-terminal domain-containing protein [Verrucomicrobiota bacterium]
MLAAAFGFGQAASAKSTTVESPGGQFTIELATGEGGRPSYRVLWRGGEIIKPSGLGFVLDGDKDWIRGFGSLIELNLSESNHSWKPVWGERSVIRDRYRGATVSYSREDGAAFRLEVRAYDEGVAFRYIIDKGPGGDTLHIATEHTEFQFTADHDVWAVTSAQGLYSKIKLSESRHDLERPCVLETAEGKVIALAEAALVDYARMRVRRPDDSNTALVSRLHGPVVSNLPLTTPWRVVMAGDTAGELLENNHLILNLNQPSRIGDTSWIKPGKVIREVSLSTQGGIDCVDFAVEYGLEYIEYDAGWYGPQDREDSDARTVSRRGLDLQKVLKYAKQHGIGVILYVNRRHLESQLDELLPVYKEWGIAGIKFGFVQHGSKKWTAWLHDAIRKCAEYGMIVDVHDEYRMTGVERTYPNFLTSEGIGGDETRPPHEQALANLFTRMIAGPADHTFCYYAGYVQDTSSHASQLAKSVCFFSPLQFLFWYDRPSQMSKDQEFEFFTHLPVTWDESRVLESKIGTYATIARRSGENWFLGSFNAVRSRNVKVPFDFLPKRKKYIAHIYSDDDSANTRTNVGIERREVTDDSVYETELSKQGGVAIRLVPKLIE